MKKIVLIGVLGMLLSGCGGSSGSSPKKGPLSGNTPLDRVTEGFIESQRYTLVATPASGLFIRNCPMGRGMLFINNTIVTGTIVSGLKKPYVIFGTYVSETGKVTGRFEEAQQSVAQYSGMMNIDGGKGTWSDDFGCHGSWEALKDK